MNSMVELDLLRSAIADDIGNDVAKYNLPECYYTELTFTVGFDGLANLLALRTDKSALREFRELAHMLYDNLPEEHKAIFSEYVKQY
jgi:thymidylate synthase (FAD)